MFIKYFIALFICFFILSCTSKPENIEENTDIIESNDEYLDTLESISVTETEADLINDFKILTVGSFHGDEIDPNIGTDNWYEIYGINNQYFLNKTKIKFEKAHDPFLDEDENEKTGIEVKSTYYENSIFLFQTKNQLEEKEINHFNIEKRFFSPNDKLNFTFLDNNYTFHAKGKIEENEYTTSIKNYEFYISTTKNNIKITQKIGGEKYLDDTGYNIIFIGDIDGDNKLDLIIDLNNHYNVSLPTLFLSSFANDNEIFVKVAEHRSVGC